MTDTRWAVIENAGYDRETVRRDDFASWVEADRWATRHYGADERDELRVDIARWDMAEGFWSYDY